MSKDFTSLDHLESTPTEWLQGNPDGYHLAQQEKDTLINYRKQLVQEIALVDAWIKECDEFINTNTNKNGNTSRCNQ